MGFEAEEGSGWLKKLYIEGSAIEVAEARVESENRIGWFVMKEKGVYTGGLRFLLYSHPQKASRNAMIGSELKHEFTLLISEYICTCDACKLHIQ